MKTYKQINKELYQKIENLRESLQKVSEENAQRKTVMKDQSLFDPIEYLKVYKKLQVCVEGLMTIHELEKNVRMTLPPEQQLKKTFSEIITEEILRTVKE